MAVWHLDRETGISDQQCIRNLEVLNDLIQEDLVFHQKMPESLAIAFRDAGLSISDTFQQ